jgi:hypothetical protein
MLQLHTLAVQRGLERFVKAVVGEQSQISGHRCSPHLKQVHEQLCMRS